MATRIMCRRFSGRPYRAAVLPTMTKAGDQKAEDVESPRITEKNCKPTVIVKVWKPPERGLSSNPSAYSQTKSMNQRDISRVLENGSLYRSNTRARVKEIQNTYSISCSRKLSSTRNTLLDIGILKGFPTYSSQIQPTQQGPTKEDGPASDASTYDRKEDARAFQKERPDYKGLCYDQHELLGLTSTEEGRCILQEVSALKSSLKPGTIAEYMFKLSCLPGEQHGIVKSSPMFVTLCYRGVESIREFEISELITILKAFVRLSIPYNHTMLSVYEAECCRRVWDMNLDHLLLVADLWHCLNYGAHRYVEIMMSCIGVHWKELSLPQLVQLVYIIGGNRRAPEELMKKLDVLVLKYLDSFSLEEIGSICLGFFKSKHGISVETMKRIADKISTRIANVSNFTLVNVLKMLRFTHVDHPEFLKQLGNVAPSQLPAMNIQAVMHMTLACAALRYLDERLLNAVAASVPSRAAYCRSKDLAKLLWSFGSLNYEPHNAEEFFASLEREIRAKMHEFQRYPQHLLTSLLALAFVKRFPVDLIDYVLGPEFNRLSKLCEFELHKDLFTLDGTVEIECPGYKGNRLAPEFRQEATNILWSFAQKELCVKPEVSEALALLEDMLGGPQYVKNHMILPHTRSVDLEIHLDCDQKPLPFNSEAERKVELKGHEVSLTDNLMNQLLKRSIDCESKVALGGQGTPVPQEQPPSARHRLPFSGGVPLTDAILNALTQSKSSSEGAVPRPEERQKGGMKLAIQVSNRNHYCYGLKHLLGLHVLKRRQLSQIGYVVVELPFWEWFPLLRSSRSEKVSYLRHKVFNFSLPGQKKCM